MSRARLLDVAAVLGVVLLAASLRAGELALIHDRGDQLIWAAIARNVSARGLEGYTVRGIDTRYEVIAGREDVSFARAELAPLTSGSEGSGELVRGLVASGESYWDAPLANQPPGFTALLVFSHWLFGHEGDGFPLLARSPIPGVRPASADAETALARRVAASPPEGAVHAQLWAAALPVASDLVAVALLWLAVVKVLGSRRAALVAAVAYATDPLALYASHRILSNSTLAAASIATLIAWDGAERRKGRDRLLWLWLAGTFAAFAVAVKVSAIGLLPAAVIASWASRRKLDPGALLFLVVPVALNAPWWILNARVLGNPLGNPWERVPDWNLHSAWGQHVTSHGPAYYLGVLASSPLVLGGALTAVLVLLRGSGALGAPEPKLDRRRSSLVFAASFGLLVIAAAHGHSGGKEGRHILLAYPLLLVIAVRAIDPARRALAAFFKNARMADVVLVLVLGALFFGQASHGLAVAYATGSPPP
jgi:hypothetical protein